MLISFVPESTHPRTKMLLAAARDDIKKAAGDKHNFDRDYHITDIEDATLDAYKQHNDRSDKEAAMSMREIEQARVIRESEVERSNSNRLAMAIVSVPFALQNELETLMNKFSESCSSNAENNEDKTSYENSPVYIKIGVAADKEELKLEDSRTGSAETGATVDECATWLKETGGNETPCYVITRLGKVGTAPVLIYLCPDAVAPRIKMKYSTAKSALIEQSFKTCNGLRYSKTSEASDVTEVIELLEEYSKNVVMTSSLPTVSDITASKIGSPGFSSPLSKMGSPIAGGVALPFMMGPGGLAGSPLANKLRQAKNTDTSAHESSSPVTNTNGDADGSVDLAGAGSSFSRPKPAGVRGVSLPGFT